MTPSNAPPSGAADAGLVIAAGIGKHIVRFVDELRAAGLPVSTAETIDAVRALEHIPIDDRAAFKAALGATLVKRATHWAAFETAFDAYFALIPRPARGSGDPNSGDPFEEVFGAAESGAGGTGDIDDLAEALFQALAHGDGDMRGLAGQATTRLAGIESGRPVGGTYYMLRTLRALAAEGVIDRLMSQARSQPISDESGAESDLDERLMREEFEERLARFRSELRDEIRRRLVDDRGSEAVAKTLRRPLLEDVDFLQATSKEMHDLRHVVAPLARRLATRLARRRRHRRRGRLDVRKTMRESLASGGVPLDPRFRRPHPHKPEIFLICDISGSVASFARFTLQLVYAMQMQFSKIRSFVFIDDIDEVTDHFDTDDLGAALERINVEANVIWIDGHSDYGHAFTRFDERWGSEVTAKSSVIITGDARNNYHSSEASVIREMSENARHLYWLNPEPRSYWDTGDSIISEYAVHCDGVHEVRNLRQLEAFIGSLVD